MTELILHLVREGHNLFGMEFLRKQGLQDLSLEDLDVQIATECILPPKTATSVILFPGTDCPSGSIHVLVISKLNYHRTLHI